MESVKIKPNREKGMSRERAYSQGSTVSKESSSSGIRKSEPSSKRQPVPMMLHCDIFRPLRDHFFSDEQESMLTIRKARPVCCSVFDSLIDEDEDMLDEEHKSMEFEEIQIRVAR